MSDFEEKVLERLDSIVEKLDQLLNGETSSEFKESAESSSGDEAETVKPSEVVNKMEQEEREKEAPPVKGRRICPECGETDFKTIENKDRVLHQQGGMKIYAKKYICKKCGHTMKK
ncbi:MAG: hypothetical protein R6U96_00245 [Promethearchaeia archaeon]